MSNSMRTIFYNFKENVDLDLPSRLRLKKRLGEYDTLAEYTFCAIRDFEANWNGEGNFEDYVTNKAILRNVNLRGGVTLPNHEPALIKSFLVNSHAMLEDFIDYYKFDIRNLLLKDFNLDSSDGYSKVERLLIPLKKLGIEALFPVWLMPVLKYYRLVRNSVAHNDKDKNECEKAFKAIDKALLYKDYVMFKDKAPNAPDDISIDDFYFYSACIKHFANYLTMALKGKVQWDDLGNIHEDFDAKNIKKGTNPIHLVNLILAKYHHRTTFDQRKKIIDTIKENKVNFYKDRKNKKK